MSISGASFAALEQLANDYLALSPGAAEKMSHLHGRIVRVELLGLNVSFQVIPGPGRLQILERTEGAPDCTLRGTPLALLGMANTAESSARLFAGEVEIVGDTELAHRFGEILRSMDIDWEEQLSRLTGDIVAHQIGNQARGALRWGRQTLQTLGLDLSEYLREELSLLPGRPEIDAFLAEVDDVRDGVERLEARHRLLANRVQERRRREGGE